MHCCRMNPNLTPVLLPSEEKRFEGRTISVQTPYREMHLVSKKPDGNCIFLDKRNRCTIYNERPLECKLFPFLLDFSDGIGTRLATEKCPHINTLVANPESIRSLVNQNEFPQDWILGYQSPSEV